MAERRIKGQYKNFQQQIDCSISRIDQLLGRLRQKPECVLGSIDNVYDFRKSAQFRLQFCSKAALQESTLNIEEADNYEFIPILDGNRQQMLLESEEPQYDDRYLSLLKLQQPLTITAETRSNWIKRYLDKGDCNLYVQEQGQVLQIISMENGILSYMNSQNQYMKMRSEEIYKWNQLTIQFDNFRQGYRLHMAAEGRTHLYQISLDQESRVILRASNRQHKMKRVVLLKESFMTEQKYQVVWGNYFQGNLLQDVRLEAGRYILLSLGTTPLDSVDLLLETPQNISLRTAEESHYKTKALLLDSFPELRGKGNQTSSRQIKQEYARSVYIDIGLVLEVYENIYKYQCTFEDEQPVEEDLALLFAGLYSKDQIQNRLRRGERMIKFLSIQAKPARLFVPRKHVRTGSQLMQDFKAHSVFK